MIDWIDVICTIAPAPRSIICGAKRRSRRTVARRFRFSSASQWSSVRARKQPPDVGEEVDAAHTLESRLGQGLPAFRRRQIHPDKLDAVDGLHCFAGGGDHPGAASQEAAEGGPARARAAAADEQ